MTGIGKVNYATPVKGQRGCLKYKPTLVRSCPNRVDMSRKYIPAVQLNIHSNELTNSKRHRNFQRASLTNKAGICLQAEIKNVGAKTNTTIEVMPKEKAEEVNGTLSTSILKMI